MKITLEDDNKVWPCPKCGEILRFQWPPAYHLAARSVNVNCPACKELMEVGGENAKLAVAR